MLNKPFSLSVLRKNRLFFPILILIAVLLLVFTVSQPFHKYKYRIRQGDVIYYTDEITKTEDGCVHFNGKNKKITICGNYSLIENN